jgi:GNAT superfamily N-acetyltransferase
MELVIRALDRQSIRDAYGFDDSFLVESELTLSAESGIVRYEVFPVAAYEKSYARVDLSGYLDNPEKAVYLAYLDGSVAGRVVLSVGWNRYTWIDDLAVDARSRRAGVGRALMGQTVAWTIRLGRPGIRAETQNNNVLACKFCEACRFRLGGFDRDLYRGLDLGTTEVALFWYRHLR